MTADPPARPARDPNDPLIQMNVRIPESLRDRIDLRRREKDLSRDKWVANALTWVLQQAPPATPMTNTRGRTAPPPRTR